MTQAAEDGAQRASRHYQRGLFDAVARQYAAARPGYPAELVEFVAETAGIGPGARVLEVGCGTGQLTEPLAAFGFAVTAIDLGASMVEIARERVRGGDVTFRAAAFEELDAAPGSFDLIISAAAFHWTDPEIRFRQAARLLRPGGCLAVTGASERYDEPLGSALENLWLARPAGDGAWATRPADAAAIAGSGLFGAAVERTFRRRAAYPAEDVVGVENTRAAWLSWPQDVRDSFNMELRLLLGQRKVPLTVHTPVVMARVRGLPVSAARLE